MLVLQHLIYIIIYIAQKDGQFQMLTIKNWARICALKLCRMYIFSEGTSEPKKDAQ